MWRIINERVVWKATSQTQKKGQNKATHIRVVREKTNIEVRHSDVIEKVKLV